MSSSGVLVNPECQATFARLAEKHELRYIIFKIEDKEVIVESIASHEQLGVEDDSEEQSKGTYEHFVTELKSKTDDFTDCRYGVFDFKFKSQRGASGSIPNFKIIFVQCCPDKASIKKKMLYASSAAAIKQSLGSDRVNMQIQVSDEADLSHSELLKMLMAKYSDK